VEVTLLVVRCSVLLERGSGLDERACWRTISLSLSEKVACAVPERLRSIGRHAAVDGCARRIGGTLCGPVVNRLIALAEPQRAELCPLAFRDRNQSETGAF